MKCPCLCLAILALMLAGSAQPSPQASAPDAEQRLAALRPDDPGSYLLIGERLIERLETMRLGRETLAIAVPLAADSDPSLAASAAVALASVAESVDERRGLWSLAVELDPVRGVDLRWTAGAGARAAGPAREAGRTLAALRVNDRAGAVAMAENSALRSRIIEEGVRLGHNVDRLTAVLGKWESDALNDPCRGQLTIRVRDGAGFLQQPCPDPSYHHGLRTDSPDWAMMVGIEMSLLGTTPDSWNAQAAVGLDSALPVWTLERVAKAYGVSRTRPVRRSGRWAEP
jgi:hypothetical protein